LKVLHLIKSTNLNSGGPPKVALGLVDALRKKNIHADLLSLRENKSKRITEIWHQEFNLSWPTALGRSNDLNIFLRKNIFHYNLLHIHGVWDYCLHDAIKIAQKNNIPWVISPHGMFMNSSLKKSFFKKNFALNYLSYKNNFNSSSLIFYASKEEMENSNLINLLPPKKILSNGINFKKNIIPTVNAKAMLNLSFPETRSWKRIIIYYGRINREKGIELLIDSFNTLLNSYPTTGLIISGISNDGIYEKYLIKKIYKQKIKNILFNTKLRGDDSFFLLQASDVFVLLSNQEGMSISSLEALSEGKPILVSKNCNLSSIIKLGVGIETDLSKISVVTSLNKILSMSEIDLKKMGLIARNISNNQFSWDKITDTLIIDYQNIIQNHGKTKN
jgi:glycosyltransferase involved in cell wall biosynthesis